MESKKEPLENIIEVSNNLKRLAQALNAIYSTGLANELTWSSMELEQAVKRITEIDNEALDTRLKELHETEAAILTACLHKEQS